MSGEYAHNIGPRPTSMDSTVSGMGGDTYNHDSTIEHERNIFMRAALQLLDKNEIKPGLATPGGRVASDSGSNKCILRSGPLKKASGNKLSNGGWKAKFVEIRHGEFAYEDDSSTWGDATKKKTISLVADRCRCRAVKKRSDPTIFELTEFGGIRRLWRAESQEERDAWVHSINAAMVGSAGDFEGDDAGVVFSPSPGKFSPKTSKINSSFSGLQKSSAKKAALSAESALLTPYTEGIDIFTRTRERVYRSRSADDYRALLDFFVKSHTPLVVPVGFAKNYGRRPELRRTSSHIISNQNSQVWKDMCRDVIVINGERFTGIESIICGLVRVLVDCADRIRVLQVQRQKMDCPVDPDSFLYSKGASFRDSVLGLTGLGDSTLGLMYHEGGDRCPLFDLNEGQILACAKEILYACNRTQSGGDTYDSVNSMICHDTYAVLTPFDTEAEPMEIRVDVIQRENSRGVVHNAWLDKTLVPGSADTKVRAANGVLSDSEMPLKSNNSRILSPFRKFGGGKKSRKKDKRNSDPAVYNGATTPPTPLGLRGDIDGDESTPMRYGKNHKRTETTSTASSVRTPVQPYFARDYDENTSDEEGSNIKRHSDWHNPASCATDDLSQPLGIAESDYPRPKSTNLPPPTLTNAYRDRWGASFSSVPDESSLGSSNGGQTSVSSSDNSGAIRSRVKAMFSLRQKSASSTHIDAKERFEGSEMSEEDSKQSKSIAMTSASASSGAYSVPSLPLHTLRIDNNIPPTLPARKVRISEKSAESPMNSSGAGAATPSEINTTPRKVVNVDDISTCGEDDRDAVENFPVDEAEISPSGVHTRFIKNSSGPNEISDRPMCIRVEVRAKSRYKICSMDPQGEGDDTWAAVTGIFQQLFYLKSFCNGKPSVSDKVVSIGFDALESRSELSS